MLFYLWHFFKKSDTNFHETLTLLIESIKLLARLISPPASIKSTMNIHFTRIMNMFNKSIKFPHDLMIQPEHEPESMNFMERQKPWHALDKKLTSVVVRRWMKTEPAIKRKRVERNKLLMFLCCFCYWCRYSFLLCLRSSCTKINSIQTTDDVSMQSHQVEVHRFA